MGLINRNVPLHSTEFQWWNPTRIVFGNGKVRDLADDLDLDWYFDRKEKVIVVTDPGVKKAGVLDYLLDSLKGSSREVVAIFDKVLPESDIDQVYEIANMAKESKPDFWIALGGGSVIDATKMAAVIESEGGEVEDYEGFYMVEKETKPIIVIPTTAGTGSEVTWGAVIMDRHTKRKIICGDYKFIPKVAVLDPECTRTLPPHIVVGTALDAMTHAIGSLVSDQRQDLSSSLSLRVVEIVADNLEEAYHNNATNLDVRSKLMIAANMAGISFQTALPGADHGIGHTAGALHEIHHGIAVAIANLYVMEYNMKAVPNVYASVARALGVKDDGASDEVMGMRAIDKLKELYGKVDVKLTYKDYGFPTDQETIERLIEQSMEDGTMVFNPVPISRTPEFERLILNCVGV
jgi:alcohol dehydrogenase class IV